MKEQQNSTYFSRKSKQMTRRPVCFLFPCFLHISATTDRMSTQSIDTIHEKTTKQHIAFKEKQKVDSPTCVICVSMFPTYFCNDNLNIYWNYGHVTWNNNRVAYISQQIINTWLADLCDCLFPCSRDNKKLTRRSGWFFCVVVLYIFMQRQAEHLLKV